MTRRMAIKNIAFCFILFCFAIIGKTTAYAVSSGDYTYEVVGSSAVITGYFGQGGDIIIPVTIGGYKVTGIADKAFEQRYKVTGVTIPDSVTEIGSRAFKDCSMLKSINIPDSISKIDSYAFYGCVSLTDINIPNSVTSIGNFAFAYCDCLVGVTLSENITVIGESMFLSCTDLTSITIPEGVTGIGNDSFSNCDNLSSITLPQSVTSIGVGSFSHCDKLASVTMQNGLTSIGSSAFSECDSLTCVIIPDSVTFLGNGAFSGCDKLANVTLPNGIISINNGLFNGCFSLTSVIIPDSVTFINNSAFSSCLGLKSVTIGSNLTGMGSYAFCDCKSLRIIIANPITAPSTFTDSFLGVPSSVALYLPANAIGYDKDPWIQFNAPALTVPADVTVPATGERTVVDIGKAAVTDVDTPADEIIISNDAPEAGFLIGTTVVKWTATDSSGKSTSLTQLVTVKLKVEPVPSLEKTDHFSYIKGYQSGEVKPLNNITREEVAMIFYRLLTEDSRNEFFSNSNPFNDIESGRWSNDEISTLYNAGILKGYEDGGFNPDAPITRAEFTAIASRFDTLETGGTLKFTDIDGHWAENYIISAEIKGWIKGYKDNTFKPDNDITRAEAITIANNMLGRIVTSENICEGAVLWSDNPSSAWYYEAVEEATNSHSYYVDNNGIEIWTGLKANNA